MLIDTVHIALTWKVISCLFSKWFKQDHAVYMAQWIFIVFASCRYVRNVLEASFSPSQATNFFPSQRASIAKNKVFVSEQ